MRQAESYRSSAWKHDAGLVVACELAEIFPSDVCPKKSTIVLFASLSLLERLEAVLLKALELTACKSSHAISIVLLVFAIWTSSVSDVLSCTACQPSHVCCSFFGPVRLERE